MDTTCLFCQIAAGELIAPIVFEDDVSVAFLDHRPVFPGHTLLIPKSHFETLSDLPTELIGPYFTNAKRLAQAIELALEAQGTFLGINNRISQSVPHLHVHVIPRRRKDGLRGFFWPRQKYENSEVQLMVRDAIRSAVARLS